MITQQAYRPAAYCSGNGYPEWPRGMTPMGAMQPMQSMQPMTGFPPQVTSGSAMTPTGTVVQVQAPVFEQSYIENILRLNLGKTGTFYMTYENNREWNAKIFKGVLEAAGRDHIIISEPATGKRIILLMVNLDYATFNEPLVYQYPGVMGSPGTSPVR